MIFWESCESDKAPFDNLVRVAVLVENYLNRAFACSVLSGLDVKLRYIPIAINLDARSRYPERSVARVKQRIFDAAPQLDDTVFINGTLSDQLDEYLRGIKTASSHLKKFGATPEQVSTFDRILADAREVIMKRRMLPK